MEIIKKFIDNELARKDWYQNIKSHIKAIVLYGSVVKGKSHPGSDIDFLIISPLEIEKKYTKGEYFFKYQGYKINVVMRSVERLRKLAKENDDFQAEVFRGSEIIWQKDDEVSELIKKIRKEK